MKKLYVCCTLFLTSTAFAQSAQENTLKTAGSNQTITIDSVMVGTDLTNEQMTSFSIVSIDEFGDTLFNESPLISFDMYRKIESLRSTDENVYFQYGKYLILIYRRTLNEHQEQ